VLVVLQFQFRMPSIISFYRQKIAHDTHRFIRCDKNRSINSLFLIVSICLLLYLVHRQFLWLRLT
jgi:hypothetical protein